MPEMQKHDAARFIYLIAASVIQEHPKDSYPNWKEEIKCRCARSIPKIPYDSLAVGGALDSALAQLTPRKRF